MALRPFFALMLATASHPAGRADDLKIGELSAVGHRHEIVLNLTEGLRGGTGEVIYEIYRGTRPHFAIDPAHPYATVREFPFVDRIRQSPGTMFYYKVVGRDGAGHRVPALPFGTTSRPVDAITDPLVAAASLATDEFNIVNIGDSITQGVIIGEDKAPPVALAQELAARTGALVHFENKGISGRTTLDWRPGTPLYQTAIDGARALQKANPEGRLLFSVMLGTNDSSARTFLSDALGHLTPASNQELHDNLKAMIDGLLAAFPEAKIFLHHPIWYSPNTYNGAIYREDGLDRLVGYIPVIDGLVREYGRTRRRSVYLGDTDAFAFFAKNYATEFVAEPAHKGYGTFYLHPNAVGAADLGRFQANAICRALFK